MKLLKLFIFISLIISLSTCATAQKKKTSTYSIKTRFSQSITDSVIIFGTVKDNVTLEPLQFAKMEINGKINNVGPNGEYKISVLPGDYLLIVRNTFYKDAKTKKLKLKQGDRVNLDFYLHPVQTSIDD